MSESERQRERKDLLLQIDDAERTEACLEKQKRDAQSALARVAAALETSDPYGFLKPIGEGKFDGPFGEFSMPTYETVTGILERLTHVRKDLKQLRELKERM